VSQQCTARQRSVHALAKLAASAATRSVGVIRYCFCCCCCCCVVIGMRRRRQYVVKSQVSDLITMSLANDTWDVYATQFIIYCRKINEDFWRQFIISSSSVMWILFCPVRLSVCIMTQLATGIAGRVNRQSQQV